MYKYLVKVGMFSQSQMFPRSSPMRKGGFWTDANIRRHTIRRDNRERGEEKKSSGATSSISDHSSNQALPCSIPVALSSCPAPEFLLLQPNVTCDSTDVAALRLLLSNFNETPL
ncbi:hypothetical protein NL676_035386 [Syzygium grande]|nr:hypothetical protein NL676_035386 [Syzygium grande]